MTCVMIKEIRLAYLIEKSNYEPWFIGNDYCTVYRKQHHSINPMSKSSVSFTNYPQLIVKQNSLAFKRIVSKISGSSNTNKSMTIGINSVSNQKATDMSVNGPVNDY